MQILPLNPPPTFNILPICSFKFHSKGEPKMAKKPMTKSQMVSHLAGKCELSKKASAAFLDEYAALAVSETKETGSFVLPGIGKVVQIGNEAPTLKNVEMSLEGNILTIKVDLLKEFGISQLSG
jgi:nucleoid DNA-binding protein